MIINHERKKDFTDFNSTITFSEITIAKTLCNKMSPSCNVSGRYGKTVNKNPVNIGNMKKFLKVFLSKKKVIPR